MRLHSIRQTNQFGHTILRGNFMKFVVEYTIPHGKAGRVLVYAANEREAYEKVKNGRDPLNNNGIVIYHIGAISEEIK